MPLEVSSSDDDVSSGEAIKLPPCKVCGQKASGYHYGLNTCQACKSFFKRCLLRSSIRKCKKDGDCQLVSVGKKHICAFCRYQKCVKLGMSKDSIQNGRYTDEKRLKDKEEVRRYQEQRLRDNADENDRDKISCNDPGKGKLDHLSCNDPAVASPGSVTSDTTEVNESIDAASPGTDWSSTSSPNSVDVTTHSKDFFIPKKRPRLKSTTDYDIHKRTRWDPTIKKEPNVPCTPKPISTKPIPAKNLKTICKNNPEETPSTSNSTSLDVRLPKKEGKSDITCGSLGYTNVDNVGNQEKRASTSLDGFDDDSLLRLKQIDDLIVALCNVEKPESLTYKSPEDEECVIESNKLMQQKEMKRAVIGDVSPLQAKDYESFYKVTGMDVDGRKAMMERALPFMKSIQEFLERFMNVLPGLSELDREDWKILFNAGFTLFYTLKYYMYYNVKEKTFSWFDWGIYFSAKVVQQYTDVIVKIKDLNPSNEEINVLIAYGILTNENLEVKPVNQPIVDSCRQMVTAALRLCLSRYHDNDDAMFQRYHETIKDVQAASKALEPERRGIYSVCRINYPEYNQKQSS